MELCHEFKARGICIKVYVRGNGWDWVWETSGNRQGTEKSKNYEFSVLGNYDHVDLRCISSCFLGIIVNVNVIEITEKTRIAIQKNTLNHENWKCSLRSTYSQSPIPPLPLPSPLCSLLWFHSDLCLWWKLHVWSIQIEIRSIKRKFISIFINSSSESIPSNGQINLMNR